MFTNHEDKELTRLILVLSSESGDTFSDIVLSIEGLSFSEAKATLQDDILTWQARNQFADDYNNGDVI